MIALLISVLRGADYGRRQVKLAFSIVVWDLLALTALETLLVAITQTLLHPLVALFGLFWILLTAGVIWHKGGVWVDTGFLARIVGLKAGGEFTNALNIFFFIQAAVVTFFLFIPIYKFWPGYFALMVLLVGLATSGALAKAKWNWVFSRYLFSALVSVVLGITVLMAGYEFLVGKPISLDWIRGQIHNGLNTFVLIGLALLILGFVFKKSFLKGSGGLILALAIIVALAGPQLKTWVKALEGRSKAPSVVPRYAPPTAYNYNKELGQRDIFIRPDKLSDRIEVGHNTCWSINTGDIRSASIEVYDAETEKYLCKLSDLTSRELMRGVKLKGPDGIIKFSWKKK